MSDEPSGRRRHLGRGLSALLGEEESDFAELDKLRQSRTAPIEHLHPGPFQPRRHFDDEALASLVESIREKGVLQPLLVRRHPDEPNHFQIIAGERRWRAAQRARLHEIPIVVKEIADREALEIALIENVQRQDLTPVEEAEGYARLIEDYGHTQDALAQAIGKSRSHIANTMRLLNLPDGVRLLLQEGKLTAGHARALIGTEDPQALAETVVGRGLNVRQTEKLVKTERGDTAPPAVRKRRQRSQSGGSAGDPDIRDLEESLSGRLGVRVTIDHGPSGGTLSLSYGALEQLDDLVARLSRDPARPGEDGTRADELPDGSAIGNGDGFGQPMWDREPGGRDPDAALTPESIERLLRGAMDEPEPGESGPTDVTSNDEATTDDEAIPRQ